MDSDDERTTSEAGARQDAPQSAASADPAPDPAPNPAVPRQPTDGPQESTEASKDPQDSQAAHDPAEDPETAQEPTPAAVSAGTGTTGTATLDDATPGDGAPDAEPTFTGISALSSRYQVIAALAFAVIGVTTCLHLLMVFLSVAPSNTMTKQHGKLVDDWVLPEFEQNWKLFAPDPLQQNIAVEARAQVRTTSGNMETTRWYNFSALDGAAIHGNPLPSHTQQNELRRAWDFFTASHDGENQSSGSRGGLSEQYLRRITLLRLNRIGVGDGMKDVSLVESIQIRAVTTNVQPPSWGGAGTVSTVPAYRTLPWWPVTPADLPLNAASAAAHPEDSKTEAKAR